MSNEYSCIDCAMSGCEFPDRGRPKFCPTDDFELEREQWLLERLDEEENRRVIENEILLPVAMRMLELSDTDISDTLANSLSTQIAKNMMAEMQAQIDSQQMQMDGMQQQINATQQALPPESQEQLAQEPLAGSPVPNPLEGAPDVAPAPMGGMGSLAGSPVPPEMEEPGFDENYETAGQQVNSFDHMMMI